MGVVWNHCKSKTVCEPDNAKEEGAGPENKEPKRSHGESEHIQPQIRSLYMALSTSHPLLTLSSSRLRRM
jgi:hypothetical protein